MTCESVIEFIYHCFSYLFVFISFMLILLTVQREYWRHPGGELFKCPYR